MLFVTTAYRQNRALPEVMSRVLCGVAESGENLAQIAFSSMNFDSLIEEVNPFPLRFTQPLREKLFLCLSGEFFL